MSSSKCPSEGFRSAAARDEAPAAHGDGPAGRGPRKGICTTPLFTITKFEFIRQIKKPSFWATIILIPLLIVAMMVISLLVSTSSASTTTFDENTKILITDKSGVLPEGHPLVADLTVEEGKGKVVSGETDLYFYIPADFAETKKLEFYHISEGLEIFNLDGQAIKGILKQAVAPHFDALDILALTGDFEVTDYKLTATGAPSNALGRAIIPVVFLVMFFFLITLFGGRMLMTVVEEKENRISEMILTSVSTKHLIVGKIFSMMLLGLIQILTLIIPLVVALIIYRDNAAVSSILSSIELDPVLIISNLLLFIFSTFLATGLLTYIGTITPTAKDASQFIGPVIVGVVFPLYFMQAFMATAPSGFVYFLSFFPLTAPTALMLRETFGTLTTPELIIGLVEIALLSIFIIRATVKSFQKNAINFTFVRPKLPRKKYYKM